MKPTKNMQIYRLGTMLDVPGADTTFEREREEAWQLIFFLRMHDLILDDRLPRKKEDLTKDFTLMTDDLTDEGFSVLKEGLYKWIESNDNVKRKDVNMRVLEKALEKVRNQKND